MTVEIFGGGAGGGGYVGAPVYTWATRPGSPVVGQMVYFSDAGAKGSHWYWGGAAWKPVGGQALLASLDAPSAPIANAEAFGLQYLIPAGLWQVGNVLRTNASFIKSGGTDIGNFRGRIGTLGTTADQSIFAINVLGTASRQISVVFDIRLESPTTAQLMPNTINLGQSTNNGQVAGQVTIASATGALWLSLSAVSNGTTDTLQYMQAQVYLVGRAN